LKSAHVDFDGRLDELREVASTLRRVARRHERPLPCPRRLHHHLDHLALEEAEALPALWAGCTDEELLDIRVRAGVPGPTPRT
jgi:hypothetical protein